MAFPEKFYRRILISQVIIILTLTGCGDRSKSSNETESREVVKLSFQQTHFEDVQKGCEDEGCARVVLNYPSFEGPETSAILNEKVEVVLKDIIGNSVPEKIEKNSLPALTDKFIRSYKKFKTEFPESQTGWYVKIRAQPTLAGAKFTCIQFNSESYTGGAHPIAESRFIIVDSDGKVLSGYDKFFSDLPALLKIAEDRFRTDQKIRPTQTLSDAGFIFPEDEFALPENFGFSNSGLILHYNPYEVSDYAKGAIELTISLKQLEGNYLFGN